MNRSNVLIAAVAIAGAAALVQASLRVSVYAFDLPVILLLAAAAGIAQRVPVFLFRSSAVSVAYAATIATFVLYGTGVALWVNLASAAVNAFTPARKPLRKILFNTGSLTVSAYLAGTAFELLGGHAASREPAGTVLAVAGSSLVYFAVNSTLTASIIALTSQTGALRNALAVWRENYSWMIANYVATAGAGAGLALAYEAISVVGIAVFILPVAAGWATFRAYVINSAGTRRRNEELERANERLRQTNESMSLALERLGVLKP
ncbi:MAG: hypothetical protein ACRDGT_11960 [Candidatus Limnocylindria bacterium]